MCLLFCHSLLKANPAPATHIGAQGGIQTTSLKTKSALKGPYQPLMHPYEKRQRSFTHCLHKAHTGRIKDHAVCLGSRVKEDRGPECRHLTSKKTTLCVLLHIPTPLQLTSTLLFFHHTRKRTLLALFPLLSWFTLNSFFNAFSS